MKASTPILSLVLFGCVAGTVASQFGKSQSRKDRAEASQPIAERTAEVDRRPPAIADRAPDALRGPEHDRAEAMRNRLREVADTNADEQVDDAERQAARAKMEAERQAARERMKQELLEKYDADGDGVLSDEERRQAGDAMRRLREVQDRRSPQRDRMRREAMQRFDTDGDGELSEAERANAKAQYEQQKADFISRFDADGNGSLEGAEREAAREQMRTERENRRLDVNRDGSVDDLDIHAAMNRVAGEQRLHDFNRDGVNDANDLSELINRVKDGKRSTKKD